MSEVTTYLPNISATSRETQWSQLPSRAYFKAPTRRFDIKFIGQSVAVERIETLPTRIKYLWRQCHLQSYDSWYPIAGHAILNTWLPLFFGGRQWKSNLCDSHLCYPIAHRLIDEPPELTSGGRFFDRPMKLSVICKSNVEKLPVVFLNNWISCIRVSAVDSIRLAEAESIFLIFRSNAFTSFFLFCRQGSTAAVEIFCFIFQ